jgi:hypothetical protein
MAERKPPCEHFVYAGMSVRTLRELIELDKRLEEEWTADNSCTVCGLLLPPLAKRYLERGSGRLLCATHAEEEGYRATRPRKARKGKKR